MSCIALIGGVIGCGKTTLINYFQENETSLSDNVVDEENLNISIKKIKERTFCRILLDELCPIEEQAKMMNTLKGWRCFRVDLLMAAEHFICTLNESKFIMFGPLTERSLFLFEKLKEINELKAAKNVIFLIEDNFYYRSMRYDWFQIARRANIGFCEIFLECPLDLAISRNFQRGYSIPENKIKRMLTFMEYPDPQKYKWETYSLNFSSVNTFNKTSIFEIIKTIDEATKNPAEMLIMADKIEAQTICSKNVVHQADNVIRKLISKKISSYQERNQVKDQKELILDLVEVRQKLLHSIKRGEMTLPQNLLETVKNNGIACVKKEFEDTINNLFEEVWKKKLFGFESSLNSDLSFENSELLLPFKNLKVN